MVSLDEILSGVQSGTANSLVTGVRYTTNPPGPTYLPSLDKALSTLRFPLAPTLKQVPFHAPAWSSHKGQSTSDVKPTNDVPAPSVEVADPVEQDPAGSSTPAPTPDPPKPSPLQRGDLLILQSPPRTGKTQLSLFLVMVSILPGWTELELDRSLETTIATNKPDKRYERPIDRVPQTREEIRKMAFGTLMGTGTSKRRTYTAHASTAAVVGSDARWRVKGTYRGSPSKLGASREQSERGAEQISIPDTVKEEASSSPSAAEGAPPKSSVRIPLGGNSRSAIFIHPSSHLPPLPALIRALRAHIKDKLEATSLLITAQNLEDLVTDLVERTLKRLTIVVLPPSAYALGARSVAPYASLCLALLRIPRYARADSGLGGEVGLVMVDGFGDMYWQDRWKQEQDKEEAREEIPEDAIATKKRKRDTHSTNPTMGEPIIRGAESVGMEDVMRAITEVRKQLGCVVVLTTQALMRVRGRNQGSARPEEGSADTYKDAFWKEHLPGPFPSPFNLVKRNETEHVSQEDPDIWPITAHITLLPAYTELRQFRPEITIHAALGAEGEKREKARAKAMCRGLIRMPRDTDAVAKFEFGIDEEGVIAA